MLNREREFLSELCSSYIDTQEIKITLAGTLSVREMFAGTPESVKIFLNHI